jgi:hypothetical protein
MQKITRAEEYQLRFLRKQADDYMERWCNQPNHPDVANDTKRANEELREFVDQLRKKGVYI